MKKVVGASEAKIEKKELSELEKLNHQRAAVRKLLVEGEDSLVKIVEEIREKGLQYHTYSPDSVVELPGGTFAQFLNFAVAVRTHNENLRMMFADIVDSLDTVTLGALDFQNILSQKHIHNCESGIALPAKEDVKITPTVAKKAATKKKK